jgi:tetratricopeptide (TPR) repeat protein
VECKRLISHALKLCRERGDDRLVAQVLRHLSDTNRLMGLHEEGTQQAREAFDILERLGDTVEQADCLVKLAFLLRSDNQLDAAEEAAFRAIKLLPEKGNQYRVCESHQILGEIYESKGETEKAIHHYETSARDRVLF